MRFLLGIQCDPVGQTAIWKLLDITWSICLFPTIFVFLLLVDVLPVAWQNGSGSEKSKTVRSVPGCPIFVWFRHVPPSACTFQWAQACTDDAFKWYCGDFQRLRVGKGWTRRRANNFEICSRCSGRPSGHQVGSSPVCGTITKTITNPRLLNLCTSPQLVPCVKSLLTQACLYTAQLGRTSAKFA